MLEQTLDHLQQLVSFDTRNPPRAITTGGIFDYLRANLPGFNVEVIDHGDGAVSLYAVRGTPKYLFNVHLDTVPDSPHWTADPHVMRRAEDRVIGLGVCDIKGAAAALVAAANASDGDAAFLFSSDEEANDPRCIAAFLARGIPYEAVLVAEPTMSEAVLAHRGISSVLMQFTGRAGHASGKQDAAASALHQAMRWGNRALDHVESLSHARFGGLTGLRFNIGRVEGGIKANMIAPAAGDLRRFCRTGRGAVHRDLPGPQFPGRRHRRSGKPPPGRARRGRCAGYSDRQRGGLLDRGVTVLGRRLHHAGVWPGRHRPGPHRR